MKNVKVDLKIDAQTNNDVTENTVSEDDLKLLELQLEVWKTAVSTQMHFNDMSARARRYGIALVVAIVGFAFYFLTKENYNIKAIPWLNPIHVSVLISILPPFVLYAVMRLDIGVYHQMLRGAVKFGELFEQLIITKKIMKTHQGMTEFISLYSRHKTVNGNQPLLATDIQGFNCPRFSGEGQKTAAEKISAVYWIAIVCLALVPVVLYFLTVKPS